MKTWVLEFKCRECGDMFLDELSFLSHIEKEHPYIWKKLTENQYLGLIFPKKLGRSGAEL